jgi:hypothetical protein
MRISSCLPTDLWPEILKTAGYLSNRTPKRLLQWRTPFGKLMGTPPDLANLHPFGCRAYPLIKQRPRRDKIEPRAHIGRLVGYDSTNIYRIWIPSLKKVIRTRHVTFDDALFYDPTELDLGRL